MVIKKMLRMDKGLGKPDWFYGGKIYYRSNTPHKKAYENLWGMEIRFAHGFHPSREGSSWSAYRGVMKVLGDKVWNNV